VRVVLDTNVFVSGVFFRGPPYQILRAWRDGMLEIVVTEEILSEYEQVAHRLSAQFPGVDLGPILSLLVSLGKFYDAPDLPEPVCADRDDDKFLAAALTSSCRLVISSDNHLLRASGYRGVRVLRPHRFVDDYL
jgi:putative PIN family toxin of toxin-antitoxin system